MKLFITLLLLVLGILMASFGHAEDCKETLTNLQPNPTQIKDQCKFGSCWAYASTTFFEHLLRHRDKTNITLSADYFYQKYIKKYIFKLVEIDDLRWKPDEIFPESNGNFDIKLDGGNLEGYLGNIKKWGIVPKSVTDSNMQSFKTIEGKNIYLKEIKNLLSNYFDAKKQLYKSFEKNHPANKFSKISKAYYLRLQKRHSRWHIKIIEKKYLAQKAKREKSLNELTKKIGALHKQVLSRLTTILDTHLGKDVESFMYQDQEYTPQNFYQKHFNSVKLKHYVPKNIAQEHSLMVMFLHDENFDTKPTAQTNYQIKSKAEISKMIIDNFNLSNPKPLLIGLKVFPRGEDHKIRLVDQVNGIIDMPKNTIIRGTLSSHAMVVIGRTLNADGEISSLIVQNSWGKKSHDKNIPANHNGVFKIGANYLWKMLEIISTVDD